MGADNASIFLDIHQFPSSAGRTNLDVHGIVCEWFEDARDDSARVVRGDGRAIQFASLGHRADRAVSIVGKFNLIPARFA